MWLMTGFEFAPDEPPQDKPRRDWRSWLFGLLGPRHTCTGDPGSRRPECAACTEVARSSFRP